GAGLSALPAEPRPRSPRDQPDPRHLPDHDLRVRGADRRAGGHGRAAVLLRARLRDADRRVRPLLARARLRGLRHLRVRRRDRHHAGERRARGVGRRRRAGGGGRAPDGGPLLARRDHRADVPHGGRGRVLLLLCALALGSAFAAFPIHMYWQPRLQALAGGQLRVMGWIVALLALASLTGSALVPPVVRRFARESVLFAAMLWRGAMVALLAGAASLSPALAGRLLQETAFGVIDPVSAAWTNEHVASGERATVISVRSASMTFGGALGLVAIGLVARAFGLRAAMGVSAAVFVLVAPGFALLGRAARRVALPKAVSEPVPVVATKVSP